MTKDTKLERQIRGWNKFFTVFGLCAGNLDNQSLCSLLREPILILIIISTLTYLQFSRPDIALTFFDEDGIVRFAHMFGNFLVVLLVLLTLGNINQCSEVQRKFQLLDRYGPRNVGAMIKGYLLFSILNVGFFTWMDFAEYVFFSTDVSSVDVVPVISGHLLILFNILHVLHFSVHLSWLRRVIVFLNLELNRISTQLYDKSKKGEIINDLLKTPITSQMKNDDGIETLDTIREIKVCRYLYNEFYQLSRVISDIYGTRNLLSVAFNVVFGIVFLAPAVGDIMKVLTSKIDPGRTDETITGEHIIFHCKWSVTCFLTVYGLIRASRLTVSETSITSYLVYDILELRLHPKIKSEMYKFAVQILESDVKFSAHDFFTLDNKLFLSMLATFTSYLIVMFQLNV